METRGRGIGEGKVKGRGGYGNDIHQCRLAAVLQANQGELHLLLPEEAL